MGYILHQPASWLFAHGEAILSSAAHKRLATAITKRLDHVPIAYITQHKEFYGRDFYVDERVLVPRPDTEVLVEAVLKNIRDPNIRDAKFEPRTLVDIGTGSGCIAITLALELPEAHILATDISKPALQVARNNAKRLGARNITFFQGDGLHAVPKTYHHGIDIVVSNPPYLTRTESRKQNLKHEPVGALSPTNATPQKMYTQLIRTALPYLSPTGQLWLEIGHRQAGMIKNIVQRLSGSEQPASRRRTTASRGGKFLFTTVDIIQDLSDRDRVVSISLASSQ